MNLLQQAVKYLSLAILVLMAIWSVVFFYSMLFAIKDSIDEELENHKRLIIERTLGDSLIVEKPDFDENLYTIHIIDKSEALSFKDQYSDTEILMQDADDAVPELEPVRMLTTVFKNGDEYFQLSIVNPIVEQDDLSKALLWNVVGLYILVLLSIIVVNKIVLKKLWTPFYQFLWQLKNYRIGKSEPLLLSNTSIKEFVDLQQAVDVMNRHSLTAYIRQKEFIENASHELQTPLAIACNKLELLFESDDLTTGQAQKLTETYEILQRLTKLNKSLLLLSQIENQQFSSISEICLNDLIRSCLSELNDFVEYKHISVVILKNERLTVNMDSLHAETLVSNLIRNSILHNTANGAIEIFIEANKLIVCNTGASVPLNKELIFSRFHKESGFVSGSGLGLAIAKAIATLYKADLQYHFEGNKHCFSVFFQ